MTDRSAATVAMGAVGPLGIEASRKASTRFGSVPVIGSPVSISFATLPTHSSRFAAVLIAVGETPRSRAEPFAPLTGRQSYRLRVVFPQLPIAQGEFRLYAFLGDETALHLHDLKVLRPGFTVVSPDYAVGLIRPRHFWTVTEGSGEEPLPLTAGSSTAASP